MPSDPPSGDQQQQQQSRQQPESGQQNPQPPPPPNADPPPPAPAMGLPAQMGYPAGPYPPPPYNQPQYPYNQPHYPYAQAPPPGPAYYGQPQGVYATRPPPRFAPCICCIISFCIFFVLVLTFSNLITWITLRAQIPKFKIESMTVSNFNTTTPFTANWDAKLDVQNTKKLVVYFDTIETAVVSDSDYRLGKGYVIPFMVDKKSEAKVPISVSTSGSASDPVPIWVAQSVEKERNEKGAVKFVLVFGVKTTIKGWFTRHFSLKIVCKDLNVNLPNESNKGDLTGDKRDDCSLSSGTHTN